MKNNPILEDGVIAGNLYPKYSTNNPISRALVGKFLDGTDELVARVDPPDIHEVGCGEGHLISRYTSQNRKLMASDFSKQVIALADRTAKNKGLEIDFRVKSIYSVVPEDDAATLVICAEVLEHLENPLVALDSLAKIAEPYLIVSVPREPVWRMLNMARGKYLRALGNTPGHLQHWSKSEFLKFLSGRFEILHVLTPLPWTLVLARVKK
jgi:hypothetical protein